MRGREPATRKLSGSKGARERERAIHHLAPRIASLGRWAGERERARDKVRFREERRRERARVRDCLILQCGCNIKPGFEIVLRTLGDTLLHVWWFGGCGAVRLFFELCNSSPAQPLDEHRRRFLYGANHQKRIFERLCL